MVIIGVDMENRSAEDIAKEAALKIIGITDELIAKQEAEKKKKDMQEKEVIRMIPTLYEPFRHWSEGGSVFILSDLHFDNEDCKLMDPNWIAAEEQVAIINKLVGKGDTFVCLGDVGSPKYVPMIKARKKILLLGNHDAKGAYKGLFDEIYTGPLFIADKILLSHEPVYGLPWCLNIHGHDHNNVEPYRDDCKHINLAANVCGYTPVNLGKLIKDGILADIESIHRKTIDRQIEKKLKKDTVNTGSLSSIFGNYE